MMLHFSSSKGAYGNRRNQGTLYKIVAGFFVFARLFACFSLFLNPPDGRCQMLLTFVDFMGAEFS